MGDLLSVVATGVHGSNGSVSSSNRMPENALMVTPRDLCVSTADGETLDAFLIAAPGVLAGTTGSSVGFSGFVANIGLRLVIPVYRLAMLFARETIGLRAIDLVGLLRLLHASTLRDADSSPYRLWWGGGSE
jgi:hypothetical protein